MLGAPFDWSPRGLVLNPPPRRDSRGRTADSASVGAFSTLVPWDQITRLEAVDPWPSLRIDWRQRPGWTAQDMTLRPLRGLVEEAIAPEHKPDAFGHRVQRLLLAARSYCAPDTIARGWLGAPDIEWEPVHGMPEPPSTDVVGAGAFRAAPRPTEVVAVAVRTPQTPLEALLGWLASSPDRPWDSFPREIRLSAEHAYVRRRDRRIVRAPLERLRTRLGGADEDAYYVFGRRCFLLLTKRRSCSVRAALDARLTANARTDT